MGRGGLEPPTSRLSSARSNQLSYQPKVRFRNRAGKDQSRQGLSILDAIERDTPAATCRRLSNGPKTNFRAILRKEVIQPQVPLRLPCYDFTPVADLTVAGCLLAVSEPSSGKANSHGVTGGVYKARERIHPSMLIWDY